MEFTRDSRGRRPAGYSDQWRASAEPWPIHRDSAKPTCTWGIRGRFRATWISGQMCRISQEIVKTHRDSRPSAQPAMRRMGRDSEGARQIFRDSAGSPFTWGVRARFHTSWAIGRLRMVLRQSCNIADIRGPPAWSVQRRRRGDSSKPPPGRPRFGEIATYRARHFAIIPPRGLGDGGSLRAGSELRRLGSAQTRTPRGEDRGAKPDRKNGRLEAPTGGEVGGESLRARVVGENLAGANPNTARCEMVGGEQPDQATGVENGRRKTMRRGTRTLSRWTTAMRLVYLLREFIPRRAIWGLPDSCALCFQLMGVTEYLVNVGNT